MTLKSSWRFAKRSRKPEEIRLAAIHEGWSFDAPSDRWFNGNASVSMELLIESPYPVSEILQEAERRVREGLVIGKIHLTTKRIA